MKFWPLYQNSADDMTEEDIFKRCGHRLVIPIPQSLDGVIEYVTKATPLELASLDKKVRELSSYRPPEPLWPQISADELEHILKTTGTSVALFGLVSFHPSGYIREFAVQRLSEINTGLELPFLLLRLNDWVAPVYQLALKAIHERIIPEYANALVHNIRFEFDLENRTRHEHSLILSSIKALLKSQECDGALQRGMLVSDKITRRLCFQILVDTDDDRLSQSIPQRLADPYPVIRLSAARVARMRLGVGALRTLLPRMQLDSFELVRREALYACLERLPDLAPTSLRAALLDTSAGIREIARYHLRQSRGFHFSVFYRQALVEASSPAELSVALSGLGETGTAADVELILPYLAYPLAKVRRVSVRAVSKLNGDSQIDALLAALADERPSVTHEARKALQSRLELVNKEKIWRLFQTSVSLHIRRDALTLLAGLPKWESIPFLLEAAVGNDSVTTEWASEQLRGWLSGYNRSFTKPSMAQMARLKEALHTNPDMRVLVLYNLLKARGMV